MLCPRCDMPMIPLFFSVVCDHCDNPPPEKLHHGWIVLRRGKVARGGRHYVFPNRATAERWRSVRGVTDARIAEVVSAEPFNFRPSRGSVKDLELADRLFEIYPDHRFKPAPNRAFLAPEP